MSSNITKTLASAPFVIILNHFDTYSLDAHETITNLALEPSKFAFVFVDDLSTGAELEQASIALCKEESLPHLYLNSNFLCGGEKLQELRKSKLLNYILIEHNLLPRPNMAPLEEILAQTKFVVFVNSFSPYCFSGLEILSTYDLPKNEAEYKVIYVDKLPDGEDLENAVLFKSKCANLPVLFLDKNAVGSLDELKKMHASCELEGLLATAGIFKTPDFTKLASLKADSPILVLKNNFSAYCLKVEEILDQLGLKDKSSIIDIEPPEEEQLQRAARLETHQKDAPFIFVKGTFVPSDDFINLAKDNKLLKTLQDSGVFV